MKKWLNNKRKSHVRHPSRPHCANGEGDTKAGTRSRAEQTSAGDGMMAWCHRALHIRHYQATSNSQSKTLDCGACRVATLLWTLHCVDSGNWCFKVSSWLKSSFILLGQGTCEGATGEGNTNRKQLLPLFFPRQGLPRSNKCHTGYLGQAENRLGKR